MAGPAFLLPTSKQKRSDGGWAGGHGNGGWAGSYFEVSAREIDPGLEGGDQALHGVRVVAGNERERLAQPRQPIGGDWLPHAECLIRTTVVCGGDGGGQVVVRQECLALGNQDLPSG